MTRTDATRNHLSYQTAGVYGRRWGSNYIYGTSIVLCGLTYFSDDSQTQKLVSPAIDWLKSVQNGDGGRGEKLITYKDPTQAGRGT